MDYGSCFDQLGMQWKDPSSIATIINISVLGVTKLTNVQEAIMMTAKGFDDEGTDAITIRPA